MAFVTPALQSFCEENELPEVFCTLLTNLIRLFRERNGDNHLNNTAVLAIFWAKAPDGSMVQTPFMKEVQQAFTQAHRLREKCTEGFPQSTIDKLNQQILELEGLHLLSLPLTASDSVGLINGLALIGRNYRQTVPQCATFRSLNQTLFRHLGWNHETVTIEEITDLSALTLDSVWQEQDVVWKELAKSLE